MKNDISVDEFLELASEYTMEEFGEKCIAEDGVVHLAYTSYTFDSDGKYERDIQVDFDINRMSFMNYIDGELVLEEKRESLKDVGEEISGCSFEDIIRDCVFKGFDLYGEEEV